MWGERPWDNDQAANWFAGLMNRTGLPQEIRATLKLADKGLDEETTPLLRAAAWCVLQLCHVYVWPVNDLDEDLELAIKALDFVLQDDGYCYNEEIIRRIKEEQQVLKARLNY